MCFIKTFGWPHRSQAWVFDIVFQINHFEFCAHILSTCWFSIHTIHRIPDICALPFSSKWSRCPNSLIHPICLAGLPTINAWGGTIWSPQPLLLWNNKHPNHDHILWLHWPQQTRPFYPGDGIMPRLLTALLGLTTLVNTALGPKKTSSSQTTPVYRGYIVLYFYIVAPAPHHLLWIHFWPMFNSYLIWHPA